MGMERMDFSEAVRYLADKFHVTLPDAPDDAREEERRTLRENILRLNREAAMFFHKTLYTPEGAHVLEYLHGRGLDDRTIRLFGIGASLNRWDALTKHLEAQGASVELLAQAGLTVRKEERAFDMFRNRAIFPIIDQYGNVLAFGGRAIENVQPKYLNTSDTPIFNKRLGVYAANLLRKERHLERVVLVEGYMDVVSLTQFGVTGVCATLGTALTNEQAKLLKRFAPMVYLSYDGDSAGQHAILRGLDILEAEGIPARVLDFPDGLDPDEFIRRDGKEGFDKLPALTPQAYRMRRLRAEHDLTTQEGRTAYAKACAAILRNLEPVEMENALQELIVQTGFSRDVLIAQIGMTPPKDIASAPPLPARIARPPATPVPEPENADEDVRAEELLLSLIASSRLPEDLAQEDDFRDPLLKELFLQLQSGVSAASLVENQSDEVVRARVSHLLMAQSGESTDQMLQMAHDCLSRMRLKRARAQYDEIMKRIKTLSGAEKMQALDEAKQLTATINRLK